ncbi:hypothetical protein DSC45_02055 [Streptomyces sp. YIM 130001]|uniref:ATP-binding protein n=1 Tax=Streptomyces sp. YIM 130001 TaxID=2259644 RepID=UPI000E658A5C|nr:ATP-binding protein [Streptomyces sp. YIM 130001]RII20886.1 hypothetical protein DSC45_02055 [Streptomyces sp. YIM 130001]
MKQTAVKSLGVAALGAAFAVAAGGAASAAPALPDATGALDTVTSTLPVESAAQLLPAGGSEALAASEMAVGQAAPALDQATSGLPTDAAGPVGGLLGGLPTDGLPLG